MEEANYKGRTKYPESEVGEQAKSAVPAFASIGPLAQYFSFYCACRGVLSLGGHRFPAKQCLRLRRFRSVPSSILSPTLGMASRRARQRLKGGGGGGGGGGDAGPAAEKLEQLGSREAGAEPRPESGNKAGQVWAPEGSTAFKCLLSARLCAALLSNISDCDETFNYWEPTHYLIYGKGFQTWEYSPVYAIRSYAYLLLHAWPAAFHARILQTNKILVFYFLRCLLAFVSCVCELYFYK